MPLLTLEIIWEVAQYDFYTHYRLMQIQEYSRFVNAEEYRMENHEKRQDVAARLSLMGALAFSIRNYWGDDMDSRIYSIRALMGDGIPNYDIDDDIDDGRWFRDVWEGPYGDIDDGLFTDDMILQYWNHLEWLVFRHILHEDVNLALRMKQVAQKRNFGTWLLDDYK